MNATTLVTVTHTVIAVAIIAAVSVLLGLHDLSESTAIALYSTALASVGIGTSTMLALKVPAPHQPVATTAVTPPQA